MPSPLLIYIWLAGYVVGLFIMFRFGDKDQDLFGTAIFTLVWPLSLAVGSIWWLAQIGKKNKCKGVSDG